MCHMDFVFYEIIFLFQSDWGCCGFSMKLSISTAPAKTELISTEGRVITSLILSHVLSLGSSHGSLSLVLVFLREKVFTEQIKYHVVRIATVCDAKLRNRK